MLSFVLREESGEIKSFVDSERFLKFQLIFNQENEEIQYVPIKINIDVQNNHVKNYKKILVEGCNIYFFKKKNKGGQERISPQNRGKSTKSNFREIKK